MANITSIVPISNFEIITSKIASILADELSNQKTLLTSAIAAEQAKTEPDLELIEYYTLYKDSIPSNVYEERFIEPNQSEMPFLNVVFISSTQNELVSPSTSIGICRYTIESWQGSSSSANVRGDQRATQKLKRLLGACSRIIMDRNYKDLGLGYLIGYRMVQDIMVAQPNKSDNADNNIYGKFDIEVKVSEMVPEITGVLWSRSDIDIEFSQSEKGYSWIIE